MQDVTNKLLADGLASFQKSFDTLIAASSARRRAREVARPALMRGALRGREWVELIHR